MSTDAAQPTTLEVVFSQNSLDPQSALALKNAFSPMFDEAQKWARQVATIDVTDASQVREMKLARETRLALKEGRVNADKKRKEMKEASLRYSRAVDGAFNLIKFLVEPLEQKLLEMEQFVERKEAQKKAKLTEERQHQLTHYGVAVGIYADLGGMSDADFATVLDNAKIAWEVRQKQQREAEEARVAKQKADDEERERLRVDNDRLKKEADEKEKAAAIERGKQADERNRLDAENRKKQEAQQEELRKERAKNAQADFKRKQEERERQQKEQEEAAAKRKAEAAPDAEKLRAFAVTVRALPMPQLATDKGKSVMGTLANGIEGLAKAVEKQAEAM